MEQVTKVEIEDLIEIQPSATNYNNEVLIINLGDNLEATKKGRVQINGFTLMLILDGALDININGNDYHIESKAFLDMIDFHAFQNVKRSSNFRGYHIIVKHSIMDETMRGIKRLPICNFIPRLEYPIMQLNDQEAMLLESAFMNTIKNIKRTEHVYLRDLVKNELRNLLIEMSNLIVLKGKKQDPGLFKNKDEIIAHFIMLVNKHCKKEHSVSFYASKLCVEPKYLSRILKGISGQTANKWIDDAIMQEAKMMLKDHKLTIQQIVDSLNFSDQSAFGKFFKKNSGVTPLTYRQEQFL